MTCTTCGEHNRDGAKFCDECGAPLCTNCGAELRTDAKFCDECGTATPATQAAAPTADDGAVRKTVTVMFADLVGSTAFGEVVDAESARQEMAAYHRLSREVIERHDGTLVKFIGDGVMAVFGVPDIAEDDADRAVRAGLDLQRDFREIADRIETRYDLAVELRIGINSGEIVIAKDDDDMVGDAINTAARIEAQCAPGRVLVGEQTWRLTRSAVDYEVLGEVRVKGKEEPIATFQVIAAVEDEEVATPFVGRDDELATLTAAMEETIGDGTPRLVTVIGSPGVGKTRLAAELATRADRVSTFDLRVDRAGAATFEPIADLLRGVVDLPDGLNADDAAQRLSVFVGESDDRDRLVPLLASFVGAAPLRSTQESLWAARRLVELITAERPAVIVIDDIQWAEPLFLDLLEHLVEWVDGPAFLVALARPEIREIRPAFAELGRRISEVVSLEGLDAATTEALAAGILGTDRLPAGLAARLPDSTQGNPLFVRELMRMLVDDGTIAHTPSGWALSIDVDAVEVPPTIMSLLASRVERMDDDERRVVEMAGVVGSEFARGAVAALLPDLGGTQLDRILERLRRQEVLDATGNYWGDEPMWRFHHVLIRDAAYRRLLKERRADLHRRVAEWTAATAARVGGEHEISIAFHYEQAHQNLGELGPLDADGVDLGIRAAELLTTAARRALDQDDLSAAGSLSQRAVDHLSANDPRRPELLLIGCEAFFSAARVHDGEPMLDELRTYGENDPRLAAWAAAFAGQHVVLTEPGRLAEAEPEVAAAAEALADLGDNAGIAKARLVRALVLARLGRVGDAEEELDLALFAARSAEDRRRITAVLGAAPLAAVWGPSPVARAGGRCLDIIRLLRITSASPMVEATSVRCQAVLEAMRGRFDESRHLIALAAATVEELGLRHGVLETAMYAGYIELLAGEPAAAEPHLRAAFAGLGSLGVGADAGQAAAHLARAIFAQGRVDEAAEIADRSDALAGQGLQALISSRAVRAEIAAARGETDEALRLATEAVDIAALTDLTIDHADAARSLAAVHRAAGRTSEAATAESAATRLYESKGARPALFDTVTRAEADPDAPRALRNRASAVRSAVVSALYDDRDLEGALSLMADDFVGDDRRALIGTTVTKADIGENYREQLELDSESAWRSEVLAIAGDNLALGHFTNVRNGTEFETAFLSVVEIDQTGRVIATVAFEPDDFDAAIEEMQRRYLTGEGGAFAEMVELGVTSLRALGSPDAMRALLTDDFIFVDDRTMSFDDTDVDGYVEVIASFAETVGNRSAFTRQILALSDSAMLVELSLAGGGFEWGALSLVVRRGDRICRSEVFDENDVDRALARYEELTTPAETHRDELRNRATQFITEHRDELESTVADSASFALTTVATRGNNICVSAATAEPSALGSDAEHPVVDSYHLVEVDDEGHLVRLSVFAADDLQASIFEMHDWFIAGEGAPHSEVLRTVADFTAATLAGDLERARSFLAADFRAADHNTLPLPTMGRGEFIDHWVESVGSVDGGGGTMFIPSLLRLEEGGLVGRGIHTSTSPHGFAAEWGFIIVQVLRRGEIWRSETFPEDQVDAALRRFDELISQGTLHNRASDAVWESTTALYGRRDIAGVRSLMGDGYRFEDRRALRSGNGPLSVDELVETYFTEVIEYDGEIRWEFEVVATRGERHAVIRLTFSREGSSFGSEVIEVATVDSDGLLVSEIVFDPAELRAAQDEMNEQYLEGEGAAFRDVIELAWAFGKASEQSDQEWERVGRALVAPDFEMVDHSPIGFPTMDSDTVIAAGQGLVTDRLTIVSQYYRIHARALLFRKTDHGRNQSGGAVAWDHIVLLAVRDGQVFRIEQFSVDQLEAANTRFDELTTKTEPAGNAASRSVEAGSAAEETGRVHDLLAWRGERTALHRVTSVTGSGPRLVTYVVNQVDGDGLETRLEVFDEDNLSGAQRRMTELWLDDDGSGFKEIGELARQFAECIAGRDHDGVRRLLHPDFSNRTWKLLSQRVLDTEGFIGNLAIWAEQAGSVTMVNREFLLATRIGLVGFNDVFAVDTRGAEFEWSAVFVLVAKDGKIINFEEFEPDDVDAALARFDELTADQTPNQLRD